MRPYTIASRSSICSDELGESSRRPGNKTKTGEKSIMSNRDLNGLIEAASLLQPRFAPKPMAKTDRKSRLSHKGSGRMKASKLTLTSQTVFEIGLMLWNMEVVFT